MPSTDREQLILELINDARLDPMANASRFITSFSKLTSPDEDVEQALASYGVDGSLLFKHLSKLKATAPVAWNEKLGAAAQGHSAAMIEANEQKHQLPGEKDLGDRAGDQGYDWSNLGENIYAYASNGLEAHAAFMVDWGPGPGGMQEGAGHRANIMSSDFREVGIDVTLTKKLSPTSVGAQVVTQDFGTRFDGPAVLVLGVAFQDKNKDGFYSPGEGVSKLKVSMAGASATSASSGGYTLESDATGARVVTLTGAGLKGTVKAAVALDAGDNIKLDIVNGNTLRTSTSLAVSGAVSTIEGLGRGGLTLEGGAGSQKIIGTAGEDTLAGGGGADNFVFDAKLSRSNVDRITDFSLNEKDKIHLEKDVFTKLSLGKLSEDSFALGSKATDKFDRILYDSGKLFYDADGKGGKEAVQFATLDKHPALDHLDFLVV